MDYEAVVQHIITTQGVTVVEVKRMLAAQGVEVEGDLMLYWPYAPVAIWAGASDELQEVLGRLIQDDRVEITNTQNLVYMIDGEGLTLPLANINSVLRQHPYKSDRWLPIVFNRA
ncbi:hypothetical protein KZC51_05950 [Microbacterium sp. SSW1-49]|uniref:Uncharacterized protein n=1 Tax=Microbacterium croceum TaxID=2851645 RepID=A0ABT0FCL4_9MICO|nr:hypothetical protein [Microbacterium croceum]MCK2035674.1 hypothetical protein [Microbacterium croceum]